MYGTINIAIRMPWQIDWTSQLYKKLLFIKPVLGQWKNSIRLNKAEETTLCRIPLGHTRLAYSYLLVSDNELPKCIICNGISTVNHVLCDCHRLPNLRTKCNLSLASPNFLAEKKY